MTKTKITLLLIVFLFFSSKTFSQRGQFVDDKPFHFGFTLGLNALHVGVLNSLENIDGGVYHARVSDLQPGFSVGLVGDMKLGRYFHARFVPTLHFSEAKMTFRSTSSGEKFTTSINSIPLCFPIYLKYASERHFNGRPYLIAGGGVYYDLGQDKDKPLYFRPFNYFVEFGVGCDIYMSYFKLSPELKFAVGFNNLFVPLDERKDIGMLSEADKMYSMALSKLTSRLITLSFNFE